MVKLAERIEDLLPGIIADLFVRGLWQTKIRLVLAFPQREYCPNNIDLCVFDQTKGRIARRAVGAVIWPIPAVPGGKV